LVGRVSALPALGFNFWEKKMKEYSNYKITTEPTTEPVTLAELKEHLRITDTDEDTLITSLIKVARQWAENYENKAYMTKTITAHYDDFADELKLPVTPALAITSISYIDVNGDSQDLDSGLYELDNYSVPSYIYPSYGSSYPSVRDEPNAITVIYTAGYSATADDATAIHERVKASIKLLAAHLYENRETTSEKLLREIPFGIKNLLFKRVF